MPEYINKRSKDLIGEWFKVNETSTKSQIENLDGYMDGYNFTNRSKVGAYVQLDTTAPKTVNIVSGTPTSSTKILGFIDSDPEWSEDQDYDYQSALTTKREVTVRIPCDFIATVPVRAVAALNIGASVSWLGSYRPTKDRGEAAPIFGNKSGSDGSNHILLEAVPANTYKPAAVIFNHRPLFG